MVLPTRRLDPRARARLALSLACVCLAPAEAYAWHDDGHRIVAEIAARRLSPEAKAEVDTLLADLPGYTDMAESATWADREAKADPTWAFAFSSHYVNVEGPTSARELHASCLARGGCLATAVPYYIEVLRSAWASEIDRAEALRFLIHFVGDAHQPLHAGHASDRGGNDIDELQLLEYTPGRERTNLHAAWDGGIIALTMSREALSWQAYAVALDAQISEEMSARWGRGAVYDWIEESRRFAAANGYLRADGIHAVRPGDTLGEDWYARNQAVVELRLQQAGVRLAWILEQLFGPS